MIAATLAVLFVLAYLWTLVALILWRRDRIAEIESAEIAERVSAHLAVGR